MKKKQEESKEQEKTAEEKTAEMTQKEENALLQEQIIELTDTLKRLQAEFENYKKRQEKENMQLIKNSNATLIKSILPVLDSFELAIKNSNGNTEEILKFKKGLEMIYAQLFSILKDYGLKIIETKDKKFDPYKHEVLMVKETDGEEDTILEEFQKGYMLNDVVLRHSKVMITRHTHTDEHSSANEKTIQEDKNV